MNLRRMEDARKKAAELEQEKQIKLEEQQRKSVLDTIKAGDAQRAQR